MKNSNPSANESLVVVPISKLNEIVESTVQAALTKSLPSILKRASLPTYISTSQLHRLTGWSEGKIQYMRQRKSIKYIQQGRSIVYPTEWILQYLEKHKIQPRKDVLKELKEADL